MVKPSVVFVLVHPHHSYSLPLDGEVFGRKFSPKRPLSTEGRRVAGDSKRLAEMLRGLEAAHESYKRVIDSIARNPGAHLVILPGLSEQSSELLKGESLSAEDLEKVREYGERFQPRLVQYARRRLGKGRLTRFPSFVLPDIVGALLRCAIPLRLVPFDKSARFKVLGEYKGNCVTRATRSLAGTGSGQK